MERDEQDTDEPRGDDTAEGEDAERLSEKVPEEASGEGETPLGDTDEHSDAPGPDGTD